MRIAIVGVGAVGCLIAARLPSDAHQVTLIARNTAAVRTIRREGIEMTAPDRQTTRHFVDITDDPLSIGQQDLVILCVKAYSLPGVLATLAQLIGPRTAIVPLINGIPWWYPHGQPAPLEGRRLRSLDEDGSLAAMPLDRVVGALTYVAVETLGVGRIRHVNGWQFMFGDPAPPRGARKAGQATAEEIAAVFRAGGLEGTAVADIRSHIWTKLWGNLAINPLSVLTGAGMGAICTDPGVGAVVRDMMEEAERVALRLGVRFALSLEDRLAASAAIGDFKTSMLQDYQAGKRLELDAILGAVIELAALVDVDVPHMRMIHALTALRAQTRDDDA